MLLPYVIILRIKTFIDPVAYVAEAETVLVRELFVLVSSPMMQSVFSVILVYLQAVYINKLVIKNALAQQNTLIPGLIYAVLVSLLPEYVGLSPALMANTVILVVMGQIFKIYKTPRVADNVFNIGFWTGFSSLFVPNFIYLLVVGVFSVFIMMSVKRKVLFQLFSGAFTLFILYFGAMYLMDYPIYDQVSLVNVSPKLSVFSIRGIEVYKFIGFVALAIFAVLNYNTYTLKKSIQSKKKVDILYWFLMGSMILLFIIEDITAYNVLLLCIPLSIFLNVNMIKLKNPLIQELIHVVFLSLIFAFSFGLI